MKKLLCMALALIMVLGLAACGGKTEAPAAQAPAAEAPAADTSNVANDPKVTLVMAEVNPLDTIVGKTDSFFKEKVEELSGGSITVDLQAAGVLGSENDVLDAIANGDDSIDISRISAFALNTYGCQKATLLSIPYTWTGRDHFWAFVNSDLAAEFLAEPQEIGLPLRGIFYGEEGFRHFFTNKPVNGIGDLAGMKLRVSNDPVMVGMVNGLGASATPIAFGELYSALQTGVVDGAEQPIANYKSNAFPEVANYLILDGHTLGAIQVVITDNAWAKLTEAQQAVIYEAGKLAQDYNRELSQTAENEVLDQLKAEGCVVTEVSNPAEWAEACSEIISESTASQADLYAQLLALAK